MQRIIPAIIPESFDHLTACIERVRPFAQEVQVDIVDGVFVPFTSWPYGEGGDVSALAQFTDSLDVEVDLMIHDPEAYLDAYARTGVASIVVHLESVTNIEYVLAHRAQYAYRLALSINNDTPLDALIPYIPHIDYVQFMGIAQIGSQGQPFDERVLERIAAVRSLYPSFMISIDGSVNGETAPHLRAAGADRLVSGSAILKAADPRVAYEVLTVTAE
jgi:ribulose-phosphate 3-epimerase